MYPVLPRPSRWKLLRPLVTRLIVGAALLGACAGFVPQRAAADVAAERIPAGEDPTGFFQLFDLDRSELSSVRTAVMAQDWPTAYQALWSHFARSGRAEWVLRLARQDRPGTLEVADAVKEDVFTLTGSSGKIVRSPDGKVVWENQGPSGDIEWAYFLNRHYFFRDLHVAYEQTGDNSFAEVFTSFLQDWLEQNPPPAELVRNAPWRVLEAGIRMAEWPAAFYGFLPSEQFTSRSREAMLRSMAAHGDYLVRHATTHHNHATMEMFGLANLALCFPEFASAQKWAAHAAAGMQEEARWQVYPDGVQNELAAGYHVVSLNYFRRFATLCLAAGREVSREFRDTLKRMYDYLALSIEPLGFRPANNNSDHVDIRPLLLAAADQFEQPLWRYAASGGSVGEEPPAPPSRFFPWAGQLIMRNAWNRDAQWAFFDVGPWGRAHQHHDMLHLSVSAYGRRFLVDNGRYHYPPDKWRWYFTLSRSHNVILVDGKGQNAGPLFSERPVAAVTAIRPAFDFALGTFDAGFGDGRPTLNWDGDYRSSQSIPGQHTRAVLYVRNRFWIVIDRVATDRPRIMSQLWHFHPDCVVEALPDGAITTDPGAATLRLQTVSPSGLSVRLERGVEEPEPQGWFSRVYGHKEPATCAILQSEPVTEFYAATLIHAAPADAGRARPRIVDHALGDGRALLVVDDAGTELRVLVQLTASGPRAVVCSIEGLAEAPLVVQAGESAQP